MRRVEGLQVGELALDGLHDRGFQRGAELLDVAHGDGVDDGLLVGEEAIERADREASLRGDARGGDIFQWHLLQQGTGGVEHALDGVVAAGLERECGEPQSRLRPQLERVSS